MEQHYASQIQTAWGLETVEVVLRQVNFVSVGKFNNTLTHQKVEIRWTELYPLLCQHRHQLDSTFLVFVAMLKGEKMSLVGHVNLGHPALLDGEFVDGVCRLDLSLTERPEMLFADLSFADCHCGKPRCRNCTSWIYVPAPSGVPQQISCSLEWLHRTMLDLDQPKKAFRVDFAGERALLWFMAGLFAHQRQWWLEHQVALFADKIGRLVHTRQEALQVLWRNQAGLAHVARCALVEEKSRDASQTFGDCFGRVLETCFRVGLRRACRAATGVEINYFGDCASMRECLAPLKLQIVFCTINKTL